jgi:flagellin
VGFEALIGSNQNEASIDFDSYEEGAEYSVEINGQKFSITASTSDGYSNDIDGLAGKMIATINAATHDVTGYPLGLTATVNGSSNSKVDLVQLVDASVINNFQVGTHTVDDTALGAVTMTTSNTIKYDEDDGATFTNFPSYTLKVFGVDITVPQMDVDGDSGNPADAQANYIEVARTSIDKALQDAGIEGISVSVSEDNANEILFSPVLEIENAITTDTSTVPTVTVSDGKITLEGYFSSGDQIDFNDASLSSSVQVTVSGVQTAAEVAALMVTQINSNSTTITALDNEDGTISISKPNQLSENEGVVSVGSALEAGDILKIDINGTTITAEIGSAQTTAIDAATLMVSEINAQNIAGLTVTDNVDGTFSLTQVVETETETETVQERTPLISVADNVVSVTEHLLAGDRLNLTISENSVSLLITDELTSASAAVAELIKEIRALEISGLNLNDNADGSFNLIIGGDISVMSATASHKAINTIDNALLMISGDRALFGALSNRFDKSISNLTNVASNSEMSLGRLQDADFAAETSKMTTARILEQASIAMMAQANAAKQNVLQLLG